MNIVKTYTWAVLAFAILCTTTAHAQKGWEAGGWIGSSFYLGDLNTDYDFSNPGLAGGLIARYNFNKRLCFKASANFAQVSASDADSPNAFERACTFQGHEQFFVAHGAEKLEFALSDFS